MKKYLGFTLIEILVALAIFAILATITSSSLYYAFNTRTRVNEQANRLNELQLAVSLIQQDTSQLVDRPIRGNEMRPFPSLIAQTHYLEFSRDGYTNPLSQEKRSTLKRVALVCEKGMLVHRTWPVMDMTNRKIYEDRILIQDLNACYFNYLDHDLQMLPEWREQPDAQNKQTRILPKAIQINLEIKNWGEMNLLFIIPGGLYASIP